MGKFVINNIKVCKSNPIMLLASDNILTFMSASCLLSDVFISSREHDTIKWFVIDVKGKKIKEVNNKIYF